MDRKCTSSQRADCQAIYERNAAESLLLKLPSEIREIILRMVVGDKILHISRGSATSSFDSVLSEKHHLVRCLCVAGTNHGGGASSSRTLSKNRSYDFAKIHQHCTPDSLIVQRDTLDLQIFYASRQMYESAFRLFWRTTRFCFKDGRPLGDFLIRLTESQEQNLRHVVIFIPSNVCFYEIDYHLGADSFISTCNSRRAEFYSLRHLTSLELHVQLPCTQKYAPFDPDSQLGYIALCFAIWRDLCLLPLKTGEVRIRYAEPGPARREWPAARNIPEGNLEEIAQKFRKRLLQPASAERPFEDSLAKKIKKLESSLRDLETKARADERTAAPLNKHTIGSELWPVEGSPERRESHVKAKALEERIGRLKAELHRSLHA